MYYGSEVKPDGEKGARWYDTEENELKVQLADGGWSCWKSMDAEIKRNVNGSIVWDQVASQNTAGITSASPGTVSTTVGKSCLFIKAQGSLGTGVTTPNISLTITTGGGATTFSTSFGNTNANTSTSFSTTIPLTTQGVGTNAPTSVGLASNASLIASGSVAGGTGTLSITWSHEGQDGELITRVTTAP